MKVLDRLTFSAYGMHLADQISLVCVPLVAVLIFNATAEIIGYLVAAQSMAHLLGSLPSGLIVDRFQAQRIIIIATLISLTGFMGAAFSVVFANLLWFGITITLAGFGIVLFVLVCLSILPKITEIDQLANANSRLEIPKTLASFAVPLSVGILITETIAMWVFAVAAIGGIAALVFVFKLPQFSSNKQSADGAVFQILQSSKYVLNHKLLLPISICAAFWNIAFSALLVISVPLVVEIYLLEPGVFGIALSAFGLGTIAGAWAAGRMSSRTPLNLILLFGPGCSVIASITLLFIPANSTVVAIYASFFILGFGPSMWLITQNSIRQIVTPGNILGRVNAVIQTAIHGVRPLGAVLGGIIVGATSPRHGLILVIVLFICSFIAALFSRLATIKRYSDLSISVI